MLFLDGSVSSFCFLINSFFSCVIIFCVSRLFIFGNIRSRLVQSDTWHLIEVFSFGLLHLCLGRSPLMMSAFWIYFVRIQKSRICTIAEIVSRNLVKLAWLDFALPGSERARNNAKCFEFCVSSFFFRLTRAEFFVRSKLSNFDMLNQRRFKAAPSLFCRIEQMYEIG